MTFETLKPYLYVIFLQFGNAGLIIIAKAALNHGMNHYTFATYRNLIAALIMAPFALIFERKGRPKLTFSIFLKIMLLGFLEPVVDQNLYYAGMKYTTATFAVAMTNIIPALTFLMAWICRMEKVNIKKLHSIGKIVGTLVTVGGAMIMTVVVGPTIGLPWTKGSTTTHQQQSATHVSPGDNIKGSMMIIAGCLSWSCFYIVQAITLKSYPAELSLTALICAAGALQGSIVTVIAEKGNTEAWKLQLDAGLVTMVYGVDGLSLVSQEADRVGNMGPDDVYQGLQGVRNMASHLVGSIHQIGQPSYIQTNDPGLGPDNTVPQHVPRGRGRGRGRRQRNQVNIRNDDDEGPSIRQFGGATPSYDSGPSTNRGSTPDYGGAGTSNVGGETHDWSPCYRPSFDHWGQGSSSFQPYNQLDVNNNQWFNQTPSGNMIPPIYSNQQGGFQNYDYTSHSVQQPRFQNVTPVQMSYESMELNRTQPEDSDHDEDEERPRRQQPRNTRPVYCATGGHILRNYRRDHNN